MIIDCHTHINNYENESENRTEEIFEKLQIAMRRNRVDAALILTSYTVNPGRPSTADAVRLTRDVKNIFVIAGISYLDFHLNYLMEIREYLQEGVVRGLKLYPGYEPFYPNDEKLYPVYELAGEYKVPVMVHTGDTYTPKGKIKYSHPIHIDDVAVDFPDVKFVICHLGNPWTRDTMEVVYKNNNVYTDISGLVLGDFSDRFEGYMRKQLEEMLLYGVDPGSVLYGTDWPISSMETYLKFMDEIKIPNDEKKKIYWNNSAEIFGLTPDISPFEKGSVFTWLQGNRT
jgi:uncharacterized protein